VDYNDKAGLEKTILSTRKEMEKAAKSLDFIQAARLRDQLLELEAKRGQLK
jgi:excinuclease ABC subunit B